MSDAAPASRFDCTPEAALAAVAAHEGLLLVDLDETLYLRNSTEDFIDSAVPGLLALLLMKLLDLLKPWRWTGGAPTRDAWRVRLICVLMPWTMMLWRRRVARRATGYTNQPLASALRARAPAPLIATVGFLPIVTPLLAAMGFAEARVVASRLFVFEDRRGGKLRLLSAALGDAAVREAMVISDSGDDLPLLAACARPLRVVWPDARYRTALSRCYWPTEYLARIKRPGERYFFRGVLQDDFGYWLLASVTLAAYPLFHVAGLLLLLISFWAIYELGYVDNDQVAKRFEREPKLSAEFFRNPVATPAWQPWIWAAGFGAAAIFVLRLPGRPPAADFLRWLAVLVAAHWWFRLYNRVDKNTRVWMFPVLQLARSSAFVVLVPISLVGTIALSAHLFSRWVPYYVYRFGGQDWPETQPHLIRLVFFVLIAGLFAIAVGPAAVLNYPALALLLWTAFRARREFAGAIGSASRLDHEVPREPR
ncbi:MAG TPA: hypothetical protein VK130_12645 [Steroidobacteraceae bacterium]|nr:hypothetical protein [Steroidobacteraceae bacterium]